MHEIYNPINLLNKQIEIFGWNKVMDYSETISGTKDTRPELQRLLSDARLGKFDYVMVQTHYPILPKSIPLTLFYPIQS